jgi:hypothetical protein
MVPLENRELYHERGAGQHHPLLRHNDQEGLHSQGVQKRDSKRRFTVGRVSLCFLF